MSAQPVEIPDVTATPAWNALVRHHDEIGAKHLREFFDEDPDRGRELTLTVGDMYIDYSKHRVTRETLKLLIDLAKTADLEGPRDATVAGWGSGGRRPGRRRRRALGPRLEGRVHRQAAQRRVDRRDG